MCHFVNFDIYSQTTLIRTPKGQNQVSASQRCPYYRGKKRMIFGISGTKRTVRCKEVSYYRGVCKERLDCNFSFSGSHENRIFFGVISGN